MMNEKEPRSIALPPSWAPCLHGYPLARTAQRPTPTVSRQVRQQPSLKYAHRRCNLHTYARLSKQYVKLSQTITALRFFASATHVHKGCCHTADPLRPLQLAHGPNLPTRKRKIPHPVKCQRLAASVGQVCHTCHTCDRHAQARRCTCTQYVWHAPVCGGSASAASFPLVSGHTMPDATQDAHMSWRSAPTPPCKVFRTSMLTPDVSRPVLSSSPRAFKCRRAQRTQEGRGLGGRWAKVVVYLGRGV
mmetsp:Transcript_42621/g.127924  ORF Transcript_42621/g.127924 Transcript_42621/m.127924 type:complete len:247 (+) Transcript_42621:875-1615(+)